MSKDLYKTFLNPSADDRLVLKVARLAAMGGGILAIYVAIHAASVISVLSIFYSLLSVSLFVPVVMGLYVPAADTRNAYAAIFLGVGTLLAVQFGTGGVGFGMWSPTLLGLIASVAGGVVSLLVFRRSNRQTSN